MKRQTGSWPTDKRYQSRRWRETRLAVLRRDQWTCWVARCTRLANVADHIDPVTPRTTVAEFHRVDRIRASCRPHNLARGIAGHGAPELGMTPRSGVAERGPRDPLATVRREYSARP